MLNVGFSSQARKFLKSVDDTLWSRITGKIEELCSNPFPSDSKRVKGRKEKVFRVRVGDFRILYVVFNERNLLFISKIEKRSKVYK